METPKSSESKRRGRTPGSSSSSQEIECYEDFAEQVESILTEVGSCHEDRVAELAAQVGTSAVARRVPAPHVLACEWLPRCWKEYGAGLDAKELRKALRRRCIRTELVTLPAPRSELPDAAQLKRRRLREAELQVLLRVSVPRLGKKNEGSLNKREERALQVLFEAASFDLMAPHVDCETKDHRNIASPREARTGQYASLRTFFDSLAPWLDRFAPETRIRLVESFEFDDDRSSSVPPPKRTPATRDVPVAVENGGSIPFPQRRRGNVLVSSQQVATTTTTTAAGQRKGRDEPRGEPPPVKRARFFETTTTVNRRSQVPVPKKSEKKQPLLLSRGVDRRAGALSRTTHLGLSKQSLAALARPEIAERKVKKNFQQLAALSPSPIRERVGAAKKKRRPHASPQGQPPTVVRRLSIAASPYVTSEIVSYFSSLGLRLPDSAASSPTHPPIADEHRPSTSFLWDFLFGP